MTHLELFLNPVLHVVEGLLICDIVNNNDAVRASVIAACDRAEPLLVHDSFKGATQGAAKGGRQKELGHFFSASCTGATRGA